jgi:hypothetical protein
MSLAPQTLDRLLGGVAHLGRSGRHLSSRPAAHLPGDLPSFGGALLVPLERDRTLTALAGWGDDDAGRSTELLERRAADIDAAGSSHRGALPVAAS